MPVQPTASERGCAFLSNPPSTIFSPEQFSSEEQLMAQLAEEFSRKEVLPNLAVLDRQEEPLMVDLVRKAGQLGFCGIDAPEAFGGLGLSKALSARILEFLSLDASFAVTIGVTSGISQVGLSLFGNDEQRERYLRKLTSGEWIGAYALSEPDSGTDALSLSCRADLRGDKWVLNGSKMWISNAKWADLFIVFAKIEGAKVSAFLVERDTPGVSVGREEHKMGLKASSTARLVLENVEVPQESLLHLPGQGHQVAFNSLNLGRFKLSAMSIGSSREAMRHAAIYAQERRQFGTPIAKFGLIRSKFAEMAARFYAAESMIYRTGALIDQAFSQHGGSAEGNKLAAQEFAVECSICKVFSTEAQGFIVDEALQVFGGYGFTEEFPLARMYRDARVSRIYEGTNEINRVFIADRMARSFDSGASTCESSFIGCLAAKALELRCQDQTGQGAVADLAMLAYAEQSARIRAQQNGGLHQALYDCFLNWANVKAATAFQRVSQDAVQIPASKIPNLDQLSDAVYAQNGPLQP